MASVTSKMTMAANGPLFITPPDETRRPAPVPAPPASPAPVPVFFPAVRNPPNSPALSRASSPEPSTPALDYTEAEILTQHDFDDVLRHYNHKYREASLAFTHPFWISSSVLPEAKKLITGREFIRRVEFLLAYRNDALAEHGYQVTVHRDVRIPTSMSLGPWSDIRLLAFFGCLEHVPANNIPALCDAAKEHLYCGRESKCQWKPRQEGTTAALPTEAASRSGRVRRQTVAAKKQADEEAVAVPAQRPKRAVTKRSASPAPAKPTSIKPFSGDKGARVELAAPKKRKAEEEADQEAKEENEEEKGAVVSDSEKAPASASHKRQKVSGAGKKAAAPKKDSGKGKDGKAPRKRNVAGAPARNNLGESFGRNIKLSFTHRAANKDAFEKFDRAIMPPSGPEFPLPPIPEAHKDFQPYKEGKVATLEEVGDIAGLHPSEVRLCQLLTLTAAEYKCQKRRIFLGLALWVEYNVQRQLEDPAPKSTQAVKITQVQQPCNMDVLKCTTLYHAFILFGWIGDDLTQSHKGGVPQSLLERFPREHRLELLREMAAFEKGVVSGQIAQPEYWRGTSLASTSFRLD